MSAPYIGSRINLISKSDVRYEGILCGIDTNESKVYLQHVRCYGTEDRKKDSPIAPASEVYDVIIFHSTDIKDLSVCELPPVYDPMGFNTFSHMGQGYPQYGYPMVHPQYGPQYGYYNPYHNYGMFPQNPPMIPHQEMYNSGYPPMSPNDAHDKSAQLNLTPPQKINVTTSKVPEKSEFSTSNTPTPTSEPTPSENENNSDNTPNEPSKEIPSSSTPTPLPEPKGDSPNPNSLASSEENTPKSSSHSHSKPQNHHHHNNNHHHHHNKRSNNPRNSNSVYLPKGEAKNTSSPSDKHNENVNNNTPSNPSGNSHPVENTESPASDSSAPISSNRNHNNHSNSSHNQDYRQKRGGNNLNNRGGGYKHYNRRGYDSRSHHSNSNHHSNAMHGNTSSNAPHSSESSQNSPFGKVKEEKEDFDFLSANSKFEKLSISEDLDKGKVIPSYNKDDFYDTISCEALDHDESKDKKSYYEQRKIDSETFGDLGRRNNSNNNRGRTRRYNNNNSNNNSNNRGNRNYHRGNKNSGPSS